MSEKKHKKKEKEIEIKGFKNLFDVDFLFTEEEKVKQFVNRVIEKPIGVLKGKPLKHYKKQRNIEKINKTYYVFSPKYPILTNCIMLRCKLISECWDLKKGKLKIPNKFKSLECLHQHFIDKKTREKYELKKSEKRKAKSMITLSVFEIDLIISALRYFGYRNPQIEEIISKLEHSSHFVVK